MNSVGSECKIIIEGWLDLPLVHSALHAFLTYITYTPLSTKFAFTYSERCTSRVFLVYIWFSGFHGSSESSAECKYYFARNICQVSYLKIGLRLYHLGSSRHAPLFRMMS